MKKIQMRLLCGTACLALSAAGSLILLAPPALAQTAAPVQNNNTSKAEPSQQQQLSAHQQKRQDENGGQPARQTGETGQSSATQQNQQTEGGLAQASPQTPQGKERGQARAIGVNVMVSNHMLMHAKHNRNDWLLYGRTYNNQRFSPLTQIKADNVKALAPAAIIQTGVANTFEDSPMEVNGILYIITANDHVQAYNAVTGKILWSYTPKLKYSDLCCGPEARGVAVAYGKVYVAQLDARLVALNAATGKAEWQTDPAKTLPQPTQYSFTMAPQVYDGMVIVGSAGAEYPTRGFVEAFDAKTGKVDWTFRTIASPGEPGGKSWSGNSWKTGGGSVWNTPAVDTKNGLILFGVGNPNPDNWGADRKGANAYTDSIVAIHAKTGKIAWWYQQVAHDLWDYDSAGPVVLFKAKDHGKWVPAAAQASKEGQVFIVNRLTGKLIRKSEPFVPQSGNMWTVPGSKPIDIYPGANGGGMWSPSAYSPRTHDFYVLGDNEAWTYTAEPVNTSGKSNVPQVGMRLGGKLKPVISQHPSGTIKPSGTFTAINVNNGRIAWQYQSALPMQGGALATAGNLVFTGEMDGNFDAFNAHTGQKLWHFQLGVGVNAPPITYRVNGRQYIAVAAGGNGNNGNPELMKEIGRPQYGDTVAIFALPAQLASASSDHARMSNAADSDDSQQASDTDDSGSGQADHQQSGASSSQSDSQQGASGESGNNHAAEGNPSTGTPPGATKNKGVNNTVNGSQSGTSNQAKTGGSQPGSASSGGK